MSRPQTLSGALLHAKHVRYSREIGNMGIVLTEKKKGDRVWKPREQRWEIVQ